MIQRDNIETKCWKPELYTHLQSVSGISSEREEEVVSVVQVAVDHCN